MNTRRQVAFWSPLVSILLGLLLFATFAGSRYLGSEGFSRPFGADHRLVPTWLANYQQLSPTGELLADITLSEHSVPLGAAAVTLSPELQQWLSLKVLERTSKNIDLAEVRVSTTLLRDSQAVIGQIDDFAIREGEFSQLVISRLGNGNDLVYDPPLRYPTRATQMDSWNVKGEILGRGTYVLEVKGVQPSELDSTLTDSRSCKFFEITFERTFTGAGTDSSKTVDSYCDDDLPASSRDLISGNVIRRNVLAMPNSSRLVDVSVSKSGSRIHLLGTSTPAWPMQVRVRPAIDSDQTYVFDDLSRRLIAYNLRNGKLVWSMAIRPDVVSLCGIADGVVIATLDRDLLAVSSTGEVRWILRAGDVALEPCGNVSNDSAVVVMVDGSTISFNTDDGRIESSANLGFAPANVKVLNTELGWRVFSLGADGLTSIGSDGMTVSNTNCGAGSVLTKWSATAVVCLAGSEMLIFDLQGIEIGRRKNAVVGELMSFSSAEPVGAYSVRLVRGADCREIASLTEPCLPEHSYLVTDIRGEEGRDTQVWGLGTGQYTVSVSGSYLVVNSKDGDLWRFGT